MNAATAAPPGGEAVSLIAHFPAEFPAEPHEKIDALMAVISVSEVHGRAHVVIALTTRRGAEPRKQAQRINDFGNAHVDGRVYLGERLIVIHAGVDQQ